MHEQIQCSKPHPLQIYTIEIDLKDPKDLLTVEALRGSDGDGSAETALDFALDHAKRSVIVAVIDGRPPSYSDGLSERDG